MKTSLFKTKLRDKIAASILATLAVLIITGIFTAGMVAQSVPGCNPAAGSQCILSYGVAPATDTSTYTVLNAPGAGRRYYITEIGCINSTTQGAYANVKNGGATAWSVPCPAAGAGTSFQYYPIPIRMTSTNTTIGLASSTTLNTLVYVVRGYVAQ